MIIRVCHVSDFGLIGGDLSNFLTAVTPRHPGRAGLSNCAKILPKKGEIVPKKCESRHRPFVRILLTDMCKFPKRHLVNVPPTFAKANQFGTYENVTSHF